MSEFNKSYRVRTEVGKDTQLHVKLDRKYETIELMSLSINQENAYRLHTSDYGVVAGRVLANDAFGIPNAKVSVFINIDDNDINDVIKSVLYPYNTTLDKNKEGTRYNLLPNEQINDCHTIIGTFPEKQFMLDNDNILEIYEKYYKFTTKTNNAGDFMIFGIPTGSQTIHVDIDLSDIGILSQRPRDLIYKGYNVNQFENPNKFKYDTNLSSLAQVISQDNVVEVIPFWGDEDEGTIGITRCDINVSYKFKPTCVFLGSVVSDTASNGISKKCIPTPKMGAMDEIVTGSGTIEMIRKKPDGSVEEFQIQGTQLINGDGIWCYQIPMNLDYMMTDEFGNMVPTNDPNKGIPTRTKVRFRVSMQDFETDNSNIFRCKMLIPHNPSNKDEIDYQFGSYTKDESFRDLFWNGVYSVKSYIPRIQKGSGWRNEKFTGFKRVNYYNDKNPIPYNNIRIKIPFMYSILCTLIKFFFLLSGWINKIIYFIYRAIGDKRNGVSFTVLDGTICQDELENICIIPGITINKTENNKVKCGLIVRTLSRFVDKIEGYNNVSNEETKIEILDKKSIDYKNKEQKTGQASFYVNEDDKDEKKTIYFSGFPITTSTDYLLQCLEMNLAQEYKVIQFDFYNDWINGLVYIPRWFRNITKKKSFLWGAIKWGGKIKACNNEFKATSSKRNLVQQCALSYDASNNNVINTIGCTGKKGIINVQDRNEKNLNCHKNKNVRKSVQIFENGGIVHSVKNLKEQYIYYFKPCESLTNNKFLKLFSTDIILLGTLNECDIWGIPNNLKEISTSTYQIPTNLALTDSTIEGTDYYSNFKGEGYANAADNVIKNDLFADKTTDGIAINSIYFGDLLINNIIPEEHGNYTELSGIDWGYEGPLQSPNSLKAEYLRLYKPGGHFLGMTCRNAETTIKSCVNLSRICEYGVWMSQRQELNIPKTGIPTNENDAFLPYATVPNGFISKDEISDNNFRQTFATLNCNKLRTIIDTKTGYPIYDFIYLRPTNFSGELSDYISKSGNYNRLITDSVTEKEYTFRDDNDYSIDKETKKTIKETQIMRSGEYMDREYYKFRFGLTDEEMDKNSDSFINTKKRIYLDTSEMTEIGGGTVSFPIYENSYYFYFGLNNGKTAIDEFKRQYYAVCENTTNISTKQEETDKIEIYDVKIVYNGICEDIKTGSLSVKIAENKDIFGEEEPIIILKDNTNTEKTLTNITEDKSYVFESLSGGVYSLIVSNNEGTIKETFMIEINDIKLIGELNKKDFMIDATKFSGGLVFTSDKLKYGGYISFKDNILKYNKGAEPEIEGEDNTNINIEILNINAFDKRYIKNIRIVPQNNKGEVTLYDNTPKFTFNDLIKSCSTNENGEYMIPLPYGNETYSIYIETYVNEKCKIKKVNPEDSIQYISTYEWYLGDITVDSVKSLDFKYNDISYVNTLSKYAEKKDTSGNTISDKWWETNSWLTEDNETQWKIKTSLYMDNLEIPHNINIINEGGIAPYTEIITGMKDDLSTTNNINRSDFEIVNIPTLNYNSYKDRPNFTYQIEDSKGNKCPEIPFEFPVIYKPFFMEMLLCYFGENNKYYLHGNIYNGITWDFNDGFNDSTLNDITITNLCDITEDDNVIKINEPELTTEKGGYNYNGIYSKYNGRKTSVTRELEATVYGLHNNGIIKNFDLTIGNINKTNTTYNDYTDISHKQLECFNFISETKQIDGNYVFNVSIDGNKNNYDLIPIFNDSTEGYLYPITNNKLNFDNKLFRDIINGTIKKSDISSISYQDYININAIDGNTKDLYFIAIPKDINESNITKSNSESVLQSVSISSLIDVQTLQDFYPLSLDVSVVDTKNNDGSYTTIMTIKPTNTLSKNNFIGKTIEFTFYEMVNSVKKVKTTVSGYASNDTSFEIDLSLYRNILGINHQPKTIYYYYDAYIGNIKSPTSYLKNDSGTDLNVTITCEDI